MTDWHCMIDLETLGTRYDSAIVSVGAVFFEPATGKIGDKFYRSIDLESAVRNGRVDGSTLTWWLQQKPEALKAAAAGGKPLDVVLSDLRAFYKSQNKAPVWGNGPHFDISLLEHAYHRFGFEIPWPFYQARDCRTILQIGMDLLGLSKPQFSAGTAHNALDDAVHQAKWVSDIWQQIKLRGVLPTAPVNTKPMVELDLDDDI